MEGYTMKKLLMLLFVLGLASSQVALLHADEQESEQTVEEQEEVQELDTNDVEQTEEQE